MLLRELEPEKYWSLPSTYTQEKRKLEINSMITSGNYYYQLKTDGNYSAFICDFDNDKRLISRGLSKITNEYGRLEDKVFFFDDVAAAFDKPTRIMGEIWLENGVDKNVGSILRAESNKAKSIQDDEYYKEYSKTVKLSAKDRRDIETNEFGNQKLKWRIFDVWYLDGIDLMHTPWIERQKYLSQIIERINNPLVTAVTAYPMDDMFYDNLEEIFVNGGEGVVCYNINGLPEPGKRTAHKTLKVKRELENTIDCFIIGTEPSIEDYTGKDIGTWVYWQNTKTGEKIYGQYFNNYRLGEPIKPITKGFYNNWPGAIKVGVYDNNGEIYPLCKVSGLTEEFKIELRDNFEEWKYCPVTIGGMALSESNGLSVRHPHLISIRRDDIDIKDCSLYKILMNS